MTDYSKYPYSRMLQYIEKRCIELGWSNRIDYVLSMEKAETMEKLIDIYNHVFQYLAILFFGTKKVPRDWYIVETWGYKKEYLLEELNWCLNENILRWFKRQNKPTEAQYKTAISNLRYSDNAETIQSDISKIYHNNYEDNHIYYCSIRKQHHYFQTIINQKGKINKNYINYKMDYILYSNSLAIEGHIFDIIENEFAKHHDINYEQELTQYKEALERKKIKEIEEQEKKKREKSQKDFENFNNAINSVGDFILSGLLALPFGLFGGIFSSMKKRR